MVNDDTRDNQRSIVIGAVLLSILIAGVIWYIIIFRNADTNDIENIASELGEEIVYYDDNGSPLPIDDEVVTLIDDASITPTLTPTPTETPEIAGTVNGKGGEETPVTSETGPAEAVLAISIAAFAAGAFGLWHSTRRLRHR